VRITILEEDIDESKLIQVFGGRMCRLEEMKHLLQNHSRPRTLAKYKCAGLKCLRSYPGQAARRRVARSGGAKPNGAAHRQRFYMDEICYLLSFSCLGLILCDP
jgi:hypothetical protein